jgi:WD40 repeat protein
VGVEGAVRLWSVPACAEVAALYDHQDGTETVAFSSDGQWLISGSRDKTIKLRRIPTFEEIRAAESAEATRR